MKNLYYVDTGWNEFEYGTVEWYWKGKSKNLAQWHFFHNKSNIDRDTIWIIHQWVLIQHSVAVPMYAYPHKNINPKNYLNKAGDFTAFV